MAFSLVEILIAMFVFMFGILGVLSMFPVAMNSASRSIGRVRANIVAQSTLAQLQVDCRVPIVEGQLASLGVDTDGVDPDGPYLECTVTDAFADDEWNGYFVTLTSGIRKNRSHLIWKTEASDNRLYVSPDWNPLPDTGDTFVVTRMGLPSLPRGTVDSYTAGSLTFPSSDLSWADDEWNGFYVLMLDGKSEGEFHQIADSQAPSTLVLSSAFTSATNPPASGDRFAIVRTAPTGLPRGTVNTFASPRINTTDLDCRDGQWDGFLVKMLDGNREGQVAYIDTTTRNASYDTNLDLRLSGAGEPSFDGDPAAGDSFEIQNYSVRVGYIREFIDQDVFHAGFADHHDATVAPLSWSAPWRVTPGSSDPQDTPVNAGNCGASTDADRLEVGAAGNVLHGHIAVITGPEDSDALGQTRLVIGKTGNVLDIFPSWSVTPVATDEYEVRRSLGHFLVITTGRSAGKVLPITGYSSDPTDGDTIECAGARFGEIGVKEAKSGSEYNLRNATGFMIVGGDTFLGSIIAHTEFPPATADFAKDYGYALNTFGVPKASEPQCGADVYFEGTDDAEASEYDSVCVFSEGDALTEGPVRVDVFVFRNFNNSADLWENRRPVGHVTGYIGRP